MSRAFNGASGQRLDRAAAFFAAPPGTLFAMVKLNNFSGQRVIVVTGTPATTNHSFSLQVDTGGHAVARARNTGNADAVSTATFVIGDWAFVYAWYASAASRGAGVNSTTGEGTNTSSRTPTPGGITAARFGTEMDDSTGRVNGYIAYAGAASIVLSATQLNLLGAGHDPRAVIDPADLVDFYTMDHNASPEPSDIGGVDLTVTGTSYSADNPTILAYPEGSAAIITPGMHGGCAELSGGMS